MAHAVAMRSSTPYHIPLSRWRCLRVIDEDLGTVGSLPARMYAWKQSRLGINICNTKVHSATKALAIALQLLSSISSPKQLQLDGSGNQVRHHGERGSKLPTHIATERCLASVKCDPADPSVR